MQCCQCRIELNHSFVPYPGESPVCSEQCQDALEYQTESRAFLNKEPWIRPHTVIVTPHGQTRKIQVLCLSSF